MAAPVLLTPVEVPFQNALDYTANDTAVDAGLEMYFPNNGYTILIVNNAAMATNDVTIQSVPNDVPGFEDITVTVAAESIEIFGPFDKQYWNQGGNIFVTFENNTTITVAALVLSP